MARKSDKHRFGRIAEDYGDYFLLAIGALGFLYSVGALNDVTLFPNYGEAGLFSLGGNFATFGGTTFLWGTALASLAPLAAGATNILQDMLTSGGDTVGEMMKTTEGIAAVGAPSLPILVTHISEIGSIATGGIGMQITFIAAYLGLLATLARN